MIILNFFFAMVLIASAIIFYGVPLMPFYDPVSLILVGASVLLFLVGSGHVELFFRGLRKAFSFPKEEDVEISELFAKLCRFTPAAGVFWMFHGIMIMLGNLDPNTIFAGFAVALLTPFYAVFVTAFLFWPIATRFRPFERILLNHEGTKNTKEEEKERNRCGFA